MFFENGDIRRDRLSSEIGLLLGNGEMGGLLCNDGLGFDRVWLTDFWRNEAERQSIGPIRLELVDRNDTPDRYEQILPLGTAVATTSWISSQGASYESEFFFSQATPHLLCVRLKNTSEATQTWELHLPGPAMAENPSTLKVQCEASAPPMVLPFTAATLAVRASRAYEEISGSTGKFILAPGEEWECRFALVTSFDRRDFEYSALQAAAEGRPYSDEKSAHTAIWEEDWSRIPIQLPEGLYAQTFYRSIYYTLAITGASRFLPGVCQFADSGWEMIPFSNDAGYLVPLLASLNQPAKAAAMLKEFYQPDSLRQNATVYLNLLGAAGTLDEGSGAYSFAQMIGISGRETNYIFGRQRHLDGFMPAIFHRTAELTNDPALREMTYDVLRGCSEFWLRMLYRDESTQALMIRSTLDLDEKTMGVSVLSAVIACHWTLAVFAKEARQRESDLTLAERCESSLTELYWPQNEERLLGYPGDTEDPVTNKYNCLRSFSTLGYPYCELIEGYDMPKVLRSLDSARTRNRLDDVGHGVNAMTTNMYALTEADLGRGAEAYSNASLALKRLDPSGVAMGEARTDSLFYCSTSYSTFALTTIRMLLQATGSIIRPFPAIPPEWKDVSFERLPAIHGIFVSASMKNGLVERVIYEKEGTILLETCDATPVQVEITGKHTTLKPASTL